MNRPGRKRFEGARARVLLCLMFVLLALLLADSALADPSQYGIAASTASLSTAQAGAHADFTANVDLKRDPASDVTFAGTRDFAIDLPPGLVGDVQSYPSCSISRFLASRVFSTQAPCPFDSQIGVVTINLNLQPGQNVNFTEPLYNLQGSERSPARLGFISAEFPIIMEVGVRSGGDYGLTATARGLPDFLDINAVEAVIWGVPADPAHDSLRMTPKEAFNCGYPCESADGSTRPSGLERAPFLTNPTVCGPEHVGFALTSYALPGRTFTDETALPEITGCQSLSFEPEATLAMTGDEVESPSGLDLGLRIPQERLESPDALASPDLKTVEIELPRGVSLNPAAANGLLSCSEAAVGVVSTSPLRFDPAPLACPAASKIGSAKIGIPLLPDPIEGSIFLARQDANPFGSMVAVYLVASGPGLTVKLAGRLDLDPDSGRITARFDELPRLPLSDLSLHLQGGDHGIFVTPSSCGSYRATASLAPWSGGGGGPGTVDRSVALGVSSRPGGRCSADRFEPEFVAGTTNPVAKRFSPFFLSVERADGEEPLKSFEATLPEGLVVRLKGIPYCPDATLGSLSPGGAEAASCPPRSRVGNVSVGLGAGPSPYFVNSGKAYLAGPYEGAPLSLASVIPALVGPFDLGTIVVRSAIEVNPVTGRVSIGSGPLPQTLAGIPLRYRTLRIEINRRHFVLNPSSCDPMKVRSRIDSFGGRSVGVASRFQVGSCERLGFKPRLSAGLRGASHRSSHPSLRLVLETRGRDADLAQAAVTLPAGELLDSRHIRGVCSRERYASRSCPSGSVYGEAEVWTPLLNRPLSGPIYLRSASRRLPDLVASLDGEVQIDLTGHLESRHGRIRVAFGSLPDLPLSKVRLRLAGGRRGLLVNSGSLCHDSRRMQVSMTAQSGKVANLRPRLKARCGRPS